jgi:phosphohistidine phosphatase
MKTLLLFRHAKSSWSDSSLPDVARPLNERGLKAAPLMGSVIAERAVRPSLILCSPAVRTKRTAELVLAAANLDVPVTFDERIYAATHARLLKVLAETETEHEVVMLIGHNPGLEELLAHFTGEARQMPTAALAALTLNVDSWKAIHEARAHLDWFVKPRDLQP